MFAFAMRASHATAGLIRARGRVAAVLGPTNTGKTHYAIERMLAHRSGIIGLPLRLLAREVYDRISLLKGAQACALVTGEEKIVPGEARYFVCTVEAMPLDLRPAFLAIDEIQLAADPERGHVFTDRLLHARGEEETLFLGAETMRGIIQRFVPEAHFITRPRFSDLGYTGPRKLTRLPRRAAIVAFSAEDVYGIAEIVRRQRGGAAVVLGALSPRTRNAQVALYQSGDVDFLVATDAIGMGLNMDIDHVAFAALEKFDGWGLRPLRGEEIGQIAGRAGRHMNDGTFGVTADAEPLDDEIVSRVESHRYEPVRLLQWRNSRLNFHSVDALIECLDAPPRAHGLAKARPADDFVCLRILAADDGVRDLTSGAAAVKCLWESCQIPDFRKLSAEEHARLVAQIYRYLMSEGVLPDDWLARQVARLDETEGDVATLSGRLAQIRTWTYASHRPGWVKDPVHWQETTRAVEDRLSDALHERLTQRFIDRRATALTRRLRDEDPLHTVLDDSGGVAIGGEIIGKLEGLRFTSDGHARSVHERTLRTAALKSLEGEFAARVNRLARATDDEICLSDHGKLWWQGAVVGQLTAGSHALVPNVSLLADDTLDAALRSAALNALKRWTTRHIARQLSPIIALRDALEVSATAPGALPASARGLAYQLVENLGSLDKQNMTLPADIGGAKRALGRFDIRFGRRFVFLPKILRPDAARLLALLWGIKARLAQIPPPPPAGVTSFQDDGSRHEGFLAAAGYRLKGGRAVRLDIVERIEAELQKAAAAGISADAQMPRLASYLACDFNGITRVLDDLGWSLVDVTHPSARMRVWRQRRPLKEKHQDERPRRRIYSPFSKLAILGARD